jgi:nucleoside recognition membrane protein YjiH
MEKENAVPDSAETANHPVAPEHAAGAEAPPGFRAYVAFLLIICLLSGILGAFENWLAIFDFSKLLGQFGITGDRGPIALGPGGTGVRHGFLFALSLIPTVMLALAFVEVAEHFGALRAARRILTPLMRPLLGLPGEAGLTLITSLQSSDGGGAMTRELYDAGWITDRERSILGAFQFSAGSAITVYLTASSAFIPALRVSYLVPLAVILFYKVIGTNLMRLYLAMVMDTEKTTGAAGHVR